jgi:hypothetical protein
MLEPAEIHGTICRTDGDLRHKGLCYLVLEGKNGLGGGGSADALFEGLLYYVLSMTAESVKHVWARLPGLIMYLCGG